MANLILKKDLPTTPCLQEEKRKEVRNNRWVSYSRDLTIIRDWSNLKRRTDDGQAKNVGVLFCRSAWQS
jgi:hypothetical protein